MKSKKKGRFIVIEGIDGSGKGTQTELLKKYLMTSGYKVASSKDKQISFLKEYLSERGYRVETDDYPHYKTSVWGRLIGRMLMGDFGDPNSISPYLTCLPYMIDEYFGSRKIERLVNKGTTVISNRYFTSNVHQIAKLKPEEREYFREWLWEAGWKHMGIYRPDLVIVLKIDPKISAKLIKQKGEREYVSGKGSDKVEKDIAHQRAAAKEYERMCGENNDWVVVDCDDGKGNVLPVDEINRRIVTVLTDFGFV